MCSSRAGDDAQPCLRQPDLRRGSEDAEVCAQGELEAAAESGGGDGADGGDGEGGEGGEGCAEV